MVADITIVLTAQEAVVVLVVLAVAAEVIAEAVVVQELLTL
jgi:hypothetical protein